MMATRDSELLAQVLAQNDILIRALVANQPVEVIKALNPPFQPDAKAAVDPWDADPTPRTPLLPDDWGNPDVTAEELMARNGRYGMTPRSEPEEDLVPEPSDE
jgi:hypothetical protein